MATPQVTSTLNILHGVHEVQPDGPRLAYTVYQPSQARQSTSSVKLALVAHPLGRLGGSRRDHVITSLSETLVSNGWTVLTYDSRGAGESTGSASFSLVPEAEDYTSMLEQVLLPLGESQKSESNTSVSLALIGYSAGSVAASVSNPKADAMFSLSPSHSGEHVRIRRVLISYPLSVMWALTLFRSSTFSARLEQLVSAPSPSVDSVHGSQVGQQADERVLAVHGTSDHFTASAKYGAWSDRLASLAAQSQRWESVTVQNADHFWGDSDCKSQLVNSILEFVEL
ncbi:hypothetical protein OIO90_005043 [Microbotryomycetes sp. JL221]|nr:hypothetical protein OIO90_005043 [Microbotryomycetes sp. JL221]